MGCGLKKTEGYRALQSCACACKSFTKQINILTKVGQSYGQLSLMKGVVFFHSFGIVSYLYHHDSAQGDRFEIVVAVVVLHVSSLQSKVVNLSPVKEDMEEMRYEDEGMKDDTSPQDEGVKPVTPPVDHPSLELQVPPQSQRLNEKLGFVEMCLKIKSFFTPLLLSWDKRGMKEMNHVPSASNPLNPVVRSGLI